MPIQNGKYRYIIHDCGQSVFKLFIWQHIAVSDTDSFYLSMAIAEHRFSLLCGIGT